MRKSFSGSAAPTTLSAPMGVPDTTFTVAAITNFPNTAIGPFVVTVDRGLSTEEKILCSSYVSTTITVQQRGWDGTTAQSHASGASVVCTLDADTVNHADSVTYAVGTVMPSTSAVGDTASEGSSTAPAAADHKHGRESFTTGVTSPSAPADSEFDGVSASPARADHRHARETAQTIQNDIAAVSSTLSNKRITRRIQNVTQSGTPAINTDSCDVASITGLAQAVTSFSTNLTGTPVHGDTLIIEITDNGTARALAWGASFEASTVGLPSTTVGGVMLTVGFRWDSVNSAWRCVAVA